MTSKRAVTYVEIDIPKCANVYGTAPCLAALPGGFLANDSFNYIFSNSNQAGFAGTNATLTPGSAGLLVADTSSDPMLRTPSGLAINGANDHVIRIDFERVSGSSWDGTIFYTTSGGGSHGESGSFDKSMGSSPTIGVRTVREFNMSALTNGGTDWTTHTITQIRFDFGAGSSSFRIHSIQIGRYATSDEATGTIKCFNSLGTCQSRDNYVDDPVTVRFAMPTNYLSLDIDAIPCITGVSYTPGTLSLGETVGTRSSLNVTFRDFPHNDVGFDNYLSERTYDAFSRGSFWGKFRARNPFLTGRSLRYIMGYEGQTLAQMETRHFIIDSFDGPSPSSQTFTIVAKDLLKQLDGDRAQAPVLSNGQLNADILSTDVTLTLSPSGVGVEYPTSGLVAIGGSELCYFTHDPGPGIDSNTILMLHFTGADASTTFTDSSTGARTGTANGNAQIDTAFLFTNADGSQRNSGTGLFDGTGDFVTYPDNDVWTFSGNGAFTFDFSARVSSLAATRTFFGHATDANNQYALTVSTAGALSFFVKSSSTNIVSMTSSNGVIVINTNYHIAVQRTGNVWTISVNGVQVATTTDTDSIPNFTGTFHVGSDGNGSNGFAGWLGEFRVSKVARYATIPFTPPAYKYRSSTDDLSIVQRAQKNTLAATHQAGDRVQVCLEYIGIDPADIVRDLLVTYANVPSSYIDLAAWKEETAAFLANVYTGVVTEPTSVATLVNEIIQQAGLVVWWDDVGSEMRLQVLRAVPTIADLFERGNIVKGSFQVKEQPDKRVSQVWTYFGQRNPLINLDQVDNYRSTEATIDTVGEANYGQAAIKKIFSRWIPFGGRTVATRLNRVQLGRYATPPRAINFSVRRDLSAIQLGIGYRVEGQTLQDETGAATDVGVQVTKLTPANDMIAVQAEEVSFTDFTPGTILNRTIILDSSANNVNILSVYDTLFTAPTDADVTAGVNLTVIIDSGIIIGSTSTANPALEIGIFPTSFPITLINRGRIEGKGGDGAPGQGANSNGIAGGDGGLALYTRFPITLDNSAGSIWGGGGGGGGGAGAGASSGGGGGAGTNPGAGGAASDGQGFAGSPGTDTTGGVGGADTFSFSTPLHRGGGTGGTPGVAGTAGHDNNTIGAQARSGGPGGGAGKSIDGISHITVTSAGDILGSQVN